MLVALLVLTTIGILVGLVLSVAVLVDASINETIGTAILLFLTAERLACWVIAIVAVTSSCQGCSQ